MNGHTLYTILPLIALIAAKPAPPAAPVGQLLDVQGKVEIRQGTQKPEPGALLSPLRPSDTLKVHTGRAELVLFKNGARYALAAGSAVRIGPTSLKPLAGPKPSALPSARQPFARPLAVTRRPVPQRLLGIVTRSGDDELVGPRRPMPNGAVRQSPVVLQWDGPIEGERLVLRISDGERVVHSAILKPTDRTHQVPRGALQPGTWYGWTLSAPQSEDGARRCYALLRLLSRDERAALEQEERAAAAARVTDPDHPAPVMRLAQVYERLGLFTDARTQYRAVLHLRPTDPAALAALDRLDAPLTAATTRAAARTRPRKASRR